MKPNSTQHISDLMACKGVRPSTQRIAVLKYLMEHPVHPTAEEIHQGLRPEMPTLSLTTVYNTLRVMVSHKVVDVLLMDPRNAHYDYPTYPHAHFWCKQCGKIADTPLPASVTGCKDFFGHTIEDVDIYYKGICIECSKPND